MPLLAPGYPLGTSWSEGEMVIAVHLADRENALCVSSMTRTSLCALEMVTFGFSPCRAAPGTLALDTPLVDALDLRGILWLVDVVEYVDVAYLM